LGIWELDLQGNESWILGGIDLQGPGKHLGSVVTLPFCPFKCHCKTQTSNSRSIKTINTINTPPAICQPPMQHVNRLLKHSYISLFHILTLLSVLINSSSLLNFPLSSERALRCSALRGMQRQRQSTNGQSTLSGTWEGTSAEKSEQRKVGDDPDSKQVKDRGRARTQAQVICFANGTAQSQATSAHRQRGTRLIAQN